MNCGFEIDKVTLQYVQAYAQGHIVCTRMPIVQFPLQDQRLISNHKKIKGVHMEKHMLLTVKMISEYIYMYVDVYYVYQCRNWFGYSEKSENNLRFRCIS